MSAPTSDPSLVAPENTPYRARRRSPESAPGDAVTAAETSGTNPSSKQFNEHVAADWGALLRANGMASFEDIWNLPSDWFEPINRRRGGWSGVSRVFVTKPDGGSLGLFLKRQRHHLCRAPQHFFRRTPTFQREYENLRKCRAKGLPVPRLVYFATAKRAADGRAILITEELAGYQPLRDWIRAPGRHDRSGIAVRRRVAAAAGSLIRRLHRHHLQHHALKPSNIFIRTSAEQEHQPELCLLDLEMMRWHPQPAFRDLVTLARKSAGWSNSDRMTFFLSYLGSDRLTPGGKKLWRKLAKRYRRKYGSRA